MRDALAAAVGGLLLLAAQSVFASPVQTPKPPFSYLAEDVVVSASEPGVRLAGTFTRPRGPGRYPAIVLISGSSADDRDTTSVGGHKGFLVWADYLTRLGFVVLRLDDRGVGQSTGKQATAAQVAVDMADAVRFLRARDDIWPLQVGLLGHSEGANIAGLVAQQDPTIAFLVLLAAPASSGVELSPHQQEAEFAAKNVPPYYRTLWLNTRRELLAAVMDAASDEEALQRMRETWLRLLAEGNRPSFPMPAHMEYVASAKTRWYLKHDPLPVLTSLQCPLLVVLGSKDVQVPLAHTEARLRPALRERPNATLKVVEGVNHLMQPAMKGTLDEVAQIKITVEPKVLALVAQWLMATRSAPGFGEVKP